MEATRYTYKPRMTIFIVCLAVFISMGLFLIAHLSQEPVRSHIVGRLLVRLNLDARLLINTLGWVSIAFSAAAAYAAYWTNTLGVRYVEIEDGKIRAPASNLSSKIIEIPFSDIKNVNLQKIQSSRIITVHHEKGKVQFSNIMFPIKGEFDDLLVALNKIKSNEAR